MVEFGGFEMPIQYSGILDEHRKVRSCAGMFDVSHMGEIEVRGRDALAFVQKITINDASKLETGRVQYSAMCYPDGGIVDDLLVYNMGDYFMLVVNASNKDKDFEWMKKNLEGNVNLTDASDSFSLLAIQGPQSQKILQGLTNVRLDEIQYYHFRRGKLANIDMIISRTGYTGELGYELYFSSDIATGEHVWNTIVEAGKKFELAPIGLGARDTLRLEMGFCLYGHDIDQTTNPLEAGLGWITKLDKENFIGRGALLPVKTNGVSRRLVGFVCDEKSFPRQGYEIHDREIKIGGVTSGSFSPVLEKGIGLGYVSEKYTTVGTGLDIIIREKPVGAKIVKLPFVKR